MNDLNERPEAELVPYETPQHEVMNVLNEGDPAVMLASLEKKAELAIRFKKATDTILVTQTFPSDWKQFGDKMALSSAGAERAARLFNIKMINVTKEKEEFTDSIGKGYRYVFEGTAKMDAREIYAQGAYSTRDKFLGFADQKYRPIEDINEGNIRNAAYHIFIGNAVKALLGLRHIPVDEFNKIMSGCGQDPSKATQTTYNTGSQGGTSAGDTALQAELGKILMDMANAGEMIESDNTGQKQIVESGDGASALSIAKASCKALTSFYSKKDNKIIQGKDSVKALAGKRLEIALQNIKAMKGIG